MKRLAKKVLLIGWDAADWKFLSPLMDEGLMPNLKKLVEGGVKGRLATLDPPLSPTLWTSIATGKRPYKHGIHGFTEPDPSGKGIRPINNTNRKVKAIWNILTQHKMKTHVVGWWPSHPAEPVNGVMVSNFYQRASVPLGQPWPMANGTVHPAELSDTFSKLRVHPQELTGAHIQPFVPEASKVDQRVDKRLRSIAKVTADCSTIQSAATYILDHFEWDFMGVYFDAIDHYCHGFMKYHPPHRPHIPKKDYELYKDVVKGGCRFHDMMLGRLMEMAGEETTIMLISDHGFHPDHNRPVAIPNEPAGPAIEHSPYGIIVMNGPGIKKDELIFGSSLLDITPTLLTLFGLPVAEDMDGKVLVNAFEKVPEIETIKSWENIKGEDGTHSEEISQTQEQKEAELKQLVELGYIADPGDDIEKAIKNTRDENNFYLARAYFDGGEWEEGIKLLESLHDENPEVIRYASRLAHGYQVTGKFKKARSILNHIRETFDRESPQIDVLEGTLLLAESRFRKALELFQKAEAEAGEMPHLQLRIANAYLQLNEFEKAESIILKALKSDPEEVHAHHTLGVCYYRMMKYEKAVHSFMDAIGLLYHFPNAHFYLGETLMAMERYEDAAQAYDTCLKMAPAANVVRQRLITIYEQFLEQPGKAYKYRTDFENSIKGEVTIVSGLPRSGTSMMMQMLEAGGLEIFTDKERAADESNPKGYYEHEAVKNLAKNKKWVTNANGKVVKVIAHLLEYLPMNYKYRVIFMEREVLEVVQSQQRMLVRDGKKDRTDTLPLNLVKSYEQTLEKVKSWAKKQPNVDIHFVPYSSVIDNPFMQAMLVNDFLDGGLNVEKMAQQIDSNLYREKLIATN